MEPFSFSLFSFVLFCLLQLSAFLYSLAILEIFILSSLRYLPDDMFDDMFPGLGALTNNPWFREVHIGRSSCFGPSL
jgi:hypothetical protein